MPGTGLWEEVLEVGLGYTRFPIRAVRTIALLGPCIL
jgi:hypothetical protein